MNIETGKSQWDRPEAPTPRPDGPPPGDAPPSYHHAGPADPAAVASAGDKKHTMASNNPYNPSNASQGTASPRVDDDARLAAKLQAEEDARAAGGSRGAGGPGAAGDYYSEPSGPQAGYAPGPSSQSPMPEQKRSKGGFLSKLMGKSSGSSSRPQQPQYASYPQQQPQGAYYGGYPPQQPGYGYPPGGYGGYPQQGGYYPQQPPRRQGGGGMGTAGAAALGVGGGLVGGMLLADAMEDHHDYDDGGGYDGGDGGDFGGDF